MNERLRALLKEATPGPWFMPDRGPARDFDKAWIAGVDWDGKTHLARADYNDAELIAAAVNALPLLLDVVDAARDAYKVGNKVGREEVALGSALEALDGAGK